MNNEQQQIIDEAYSNYKKNAVVGDVIDSHYEPARDKWNLYNKEEFIFFIKKDDRFSEKWELKIEERELSLEERVDIFNKKNKSGEVIIPEFKSVGDMNGWTSKILEELIPTKLITVTYKEQKIESYE